MPNASSRRDIALHLLVLTNTPALVERLRSHWDWDGPVPEFAVVASLPALRATLRTRSFDALLHCLNQAGCTPQAALKTLRDHNFETPLIVIAEPTDQHLAMKALRCGIHDVVFTDRLERLPAAVEREVREAAQRADHRAALAMLHDSEARFRALASNLPGLVFHLQREPQGRLRFIFVSEGSQRLLGIPPHELRANPQRFFSCLHDSDRQSLHRALEESAQSGQPLFWEGRLADGRWIDLRSQPQRNDDGTLLWTAMATDVTRTKNTESALRESRAQLAALSFHLEAAKEEERERIARDIHDELGSILVRLKIEAALLASKLPPELVDKARSIENLLDQAMGTASRVARQLRPGILKEFGLAAALECQAEDFAHSTGITCRAQCDEGIETDAETSLALFRIAQEALTNIAKHAHASLAVVRLKRENGNIVLEIRDNGRGIAECDLDKPKSFGLRGIRERIQSLEGSFHIANTEQGGTLLILKVPERRGNVTTNSESEPIIQPDLF